MLLLQLVAQAALWLALTAKNNDGDYCNMKYCKEHDLPHIACNNNNSFHEMCFEERTMANMTIFGPYIMRVFNTFRNELAGGWIMHLEGAKFMPELVWNYELAKLAEYRVKRCRAYERKECYAFRACPEPEAIFANMYLDTQVPQHDSAIIVNTIAYWKNALWELRNKDVRRYWPDEEPLRHIRPMALGINAVNSQIGCAALREHNQRTFHYIFICFFNMGPKDGERLYEQGEFSAADCPLGKSDKWKYLCKTEPYSNTSDVQCRP